MRRASSATAPASRDWFWVFQEPIKRVPFEVIKHTSAADLYFRLLTSLQTQKEANVFVLCGTELILTFINSAQLAPFTTQGTDVSCSNYLSAA